MPDEDSTMPEHLLEKHIIAEAIINYNVGHLAALGIKLAELVLDDFSDFKKTTDTAKHIIAVADKGRDKLLRENSDKRFPGRVSDRERPWEKR